MKTLLFSLIALSNIILITNNTLIMAQEDDEMEGDFFNKDHQIKAGEFETKISIEYKKSKEKYRSLTVYIKFK